MTETNRAPIPQKARQTVLKRDDYECQLCGNLGTRAGGDWTLHLHHRLSPHDGGTNEPANLITLCEECHHHHHSSRTDPDEINLNLEEYDISTTPADHKIIDAIESIGPAPTGQIADEACISGVHTRRRMYALAAVDVVAQNTDGQWNLAELIDEPARGRLPDNPEQAARFARDDVIRRMRNAGMSHSEISDIVGLDERTIPVAINRARAFDPPIPPASTTESDVNDLARRVASIERQLEDH